MIDHPKHDKTAEPVDTPPALRWAALVSLVTVAARRLRTSLAEQVSPHGLSESEFALLWACYQPDMDRLEAQGLTQTELAHALELSPASVSGLVEHLRRLELLDGCRSTIDRRRQLWHLTARGHELMARLLQELDGWAVSLDRTLPGSAQQSLGKLLADVLQAVTPATVVATGESTAATADLRRGVAA